VTPCKTCQTLLEGTLDSLKWKNWACERFTESMKEKHTLVPNRCLVWRMRSEKCLANYAA
jgi:hypothetical protein